MTKTVEVTKLVLDPVQVALWLILPNGKHLHLRNPVLTRSLLLRRLLESMLLVPSRLTLNEKKRKILKCHRQSWQLTQPQ